MICFVCLWTGVSALRTTQQPNVPLALKSFDPRSIAIDSWRSSEVKLPELYRYWSPVGSVILSVKWYIRASFGRICNALCNADPSRKSESTLLCFYFALEMFCSSRLFGLWRFSSHVERGSFSKLILHKQYPGFSTKCWKSCSPLCFSSVTIAGQGHWGLIEALYLIHSQDFSDPPFPSDHCFQS